MPSKSKKQEKLFGIALSIKRGETPASYSSDAARIAKTMTLKQITDFASKIVASKKKKKNKKKKLRIKK